MELQLNPWQRKVKSFLADLNGVPGTNLFCATFLPDEVRAFAELTGLHPLLVANVICGEAIFYLWGASRMVEGIHWPGMMSLTLCKTVLMTLDPSPAL